MAARRYRAIGAYYANDFDAALDEIRRVQASARDRRYIRLLGLSHRLEGLIHVVRGDFARGLDAYERALAAFQVTHAAEDEAAIQTSLAEDFELVGDLHRSWLARYASLSLIDAVRDPIARFRIFGGASLAALREDLPEAALHLQEAALVGARDARRPAAVITAYLNRAAISRRLGDSRRAAADLDDARQILATIKDPLLMSRNEARVLLAHGEALAGAQPAAALADLDRALAYFHRAGTRWEMASAYLARGRAHIAAAQPMLAEADFESGIQMFERLRSALTTENLRTSYFEQPWDLFTEMIRLQADRHDPGKALMYAERARARTLLEAVNRDGDRSVSSVDELRASLSQDVGIIYYASLDDRLLIWLLTHDGEAFISTDTRQADLARLVEQWRSESGAEGRASALKALYNDRLIRPIDRHVEGHRVLVIVPDGVLHAVPLAALVRRETGRYLVELHAIATTPSIAIFRRGTAQLPGAARVRSRARS